MLKKIIREEKRDEDISIYSKDSREAMLDDDELSPWEEGFMEGYEDIEEV